MNKRTKDISKWLLENKILLDEFLNKGTNIMRWQADLEYERKLVNGLNGNFKINFICPIHKESETLGYCEIELEFMLIRHNPISIKHIKHIQEQPYEIVDEIMLLNDDDFVHLEEDDKNKIMKAKEIIYERLKEYCE